MSEDSWPIELRRTQGGSLLRIAFDDGVTFDLTAEYLRVESPSAEVQGHSPSERRIQTGKSSVRIRDLQPVGNYAVRIVFDDGHSTGLFTWSYLRELGTDQQRRWTAYLKELAASGLSR